MRVFEGGEIFKLSYAMSIFDCDTEDYAGILDKDQIGVVIDVQNSICTVLTKTGIFKAWVFTIDESL